MAEDLIIAKGKDKSDKYQTLLPQIRALIDGEPDRIANLANVSAALKETFGWWWVGFYFVRDQQLVLGPFQGTVACTRIGFGKGVCGTAWAKKESLLVPDVEQFPGHIACSSLSVSEIVVPVLNTEGEVVAVLDVDSELYHVLDEVDVRFLNRIAAEIAFLFE